ncbi:hypothetical protein V8F06_000593 [Rhypophila decipiens]
MVHHTSSHSMWSGSCQPALSCPVLTALETLSFFRRRATGPGNQQRVKTKTSGTKNESGLIPTRLFLYTHMRPHLLVRQFSVQQCSSWGMGKRQRPAGQLIGPDNNSIREDHGINSIGRGQPNSACFFPLRSIEPAGYTRLYKTEQCTFSLQQCAYRITTARRDHNTARYSAYGLLSFAPTRCVPWLIDATLVFTRSASQVSGIYIGLFMPFMCLLCVEEAYAGPPQICGEHVRATAST